MSDDCTREWVKQEMMLWEEGVQKKFTELEAMVEKLQRRVNHLENYLDPSKPTV